MVLSTIERRYGFPSVWVGIIASVFDMSVLVSVLFISYFGGRGHKPRWLGVSLIIQGIGMLYICLSVCLSVSTYVCVCVCVCVYVCMHVCMYVCMYDLGS